MSDIQTSEMKSENIIADHEVPAEVLQAIAEGRKIVAIKLLREATGLGLANAKVLVDRAAARHRQANPQLGGITEESNTGRMVGMMLLLVVVFAVYKYFYTG